MLGAKICFTKQELSYYQYNPPHNSYSPVAISGILINYVLPCMDIPLQIPSEEQVHQEGSKIGGRAIFSFQEVFLSQRKVKLSGGRPSQRLFWILFFGSWGWKRDTGIFGNHASCRGWARRDYLENWIWVFPWVGYFRMIWILKWSFSFSRWRDYWVLLIRRWVIWVFGFLWRR